MFFKGYEPVSKNISVENCQQTKIVGGWLEVKVV
jgi:hypothetical protein